MAIITAKIIDATHLELSKPISARPGDTVRLTIVPESDEDRHWKAAAKKRFLEAYAEEDAVYDEL